LGVISPRRFPTFFSPGRTESFSARFFSLFVVNCSPLFVKRYFSPFPRTQLDRYELSFAFDVAAAGPSFSPASCPFASHFLNFWRLRYGPAVWPASSLVACPANLLSCEMPVCDLDPAMGLLFLFPTDLCAIWSARPGPFYLSAERALFFGSCFEILDLSSFYLSMTFGVTRFLRGRPSFCDVPLFFE